MLGLVFESLVRSCQLVDLPSLLPDLGLKLVRFADFLIRDGCNLSALLLQDANKILLQLHLGRVEERSLSRVRFIVHEG